MVIFHRIDRPLACNLQYLKEVRKGEERLKLNVLYPVGPPGTVLRAAFWGDFPCLCCLSWKKSHSRGLFQQGREEFL